MGVKRTSSTFKTTKRRSVLYIHWALTMDQAPDKAAEFKRPPSWCAHSLAWVNAVEIWIPPREILNGREEELEDTAFYCEMCHHVPLVTRPSTGSVPHRPHVALSRRRDMLDFRAFECWLWRRGLWTSCSLIRLRKQRPHSQRWQIPCTLSELLCAGHFPLVHCASRC